MIRRGCLFILLLLGACGCAAGLARVQEPRLPLNTGASLWKMQVEHLGAEQFSGLLALRDEQAGTALVLLDSMGLRLLAGFVSKEGDFRIDECLRPVAETRLPDLVATSVQRVFHTDVGSAAWFEEEGDVQQGLVRAATLGPLLLWAVRYQPIVGDSPPPHPAFSTAELRIPWQGLLVRFEIMR